MLLGGDRLSPKIACYYQADRDAPAPAAEGALHAANTPNSCNCCLGFERFYCFWMPSKAMVRCVLRGVKDTQRPQSPLVCFVEHLGVRVPAQRNTCTGTSSPLAQAEAKTPSVT
ncbi:hypothetical protein cyc_06050 [Cyclospora cayetanensis]|uniref:Uncharacterized protein n=1 Tax=Cyclospora cayetanensis TaxID=88456 RepID=A0A1D3CQV7_9EIME|nr:hypothetical protein cyc_06050 [Cyclospora cayetanensis]